ncbi:MAG TPA: hypothetical protein PKU83_07945, partial [Chryseolinea sp.]|nr:hypothetical protein [Chryseolinea sp.]
MNFRTVVVIALTILSCQESRNKGLVMERDIALATLEKSLQVCRSGSVDSVIACSKNTISELLKKNHDNPTFNKVWQQYGIAVALVHNGFRNEALPYIEDALSLTEEYRLDLEQAKLFGWRATINSDLNNSFEAASDFYQSADLYLSLNKFEDAAACYLGTSNLQYNTGNYQLAIDNALLGVEYFGKNANPNKWDSLQYINLFNTLGLANYQLNKLDSATKYFDHAYQYAISLDNKLWIGLVSGNAAKIDIAKGNTAIATKKLQHKFTVSLENKEFSAAGAALIVLAEVET